MSGTLRIAMDRRARPPRPAPQPATYAGGGAVTRTQARVWAPLYAAVAWLGGTFAVFWLGGLTDRVADPAGLCLFVAATIAALTAGYWLKIRGYPPVIHTDTRRADDRADTGGNVSRLVTWGAVYYAALGLFQLAEYGATGPGSIIASIEDPAAAYLNKFAVYEQVQSTGRVSLPIQILTVAGALGAVLVPLLVVHWRRLTVAVRAAGIAGLAVYASFFLYIGTLKGLGDIVVMTIAAALVVMAGNRPAGAAGKGRRHTTRIAAVLLAGFLLYMGSAQSSRLDKAGGSDMVRPSPAVVAVVGERAATGIAAIAFYPTHGYLGLAYNLGTPFVWTGGLGSAPAVTSYAEQYAGAGGVKYETYPARTEARTGWPRGQYWATIYPWLASDLTFPGAVLFMGVVGWWLARWWVEAAFWRRRLPLLLFVQLALLVAYVPANNQLGISRPSVFGFLTLFGLYVWTGSTGPRHPARR